MTRSPYATTSALMVACPECGSVKDERCQRFNTRAGHYVFLERCHPVRRKAADDARTAEVNPDAPSWNWDEETMKNRRIMRVSIDCKHAPIAKDIEPEVAEAIRAGEAHASIDAFEAITGETRSDNLSHANATIWHNMSSKPLSPEGMKVVSAALMAQLDALRKSVDTRNGWRFEIDKSSHIPCPGIELPMPEPAAKPFFTPFPAPPPEYYHNVAGRDGIFEIPPEIPLREPLPPRVPDLNPDDDYRAACAKSMKAVPFFPEGAISLMLHALMLCGLGRQHVRVEWLAELATVIAFVSGIEQNETDAIMSKAIPLMPVGIGIDVRVSP